MYGNQIKRLRSEKMLTQAQLAKAIGMKGKESTLGMWEVEKSQPGIDKLIALADFFGVSVDTILGRKLDDQRVEISDFEKKFKESRLRLEYLHLLDQIQKSILNVYSYSVAETSERILEIKHVIEAMDDLPIYIIDSDAGKYDVFGNADILHQNNNIVDSTVYLTRVHQDSWKSFNQKINNITQAIFERCSEAFINALQMSVVAKEEER